MARLNSAPSVKPLAESGRSPPLPRPIRPARRMGPLRTLATFAFAVVALLTVLPTAIVALVALAPSIGALIADDTPRRYLFRSVVGMNGAALWPFLESLWLRGNDIATAVAIVGDLYTWAAIYGAAGFGWLVFLSVPALIAAWRALRAERRIAALTKLQEKLREEWGGAIEALETRKPETE